ncbi:MULTISPECIES: methyltransferase family protein [Rhizobium/Agrobacterium group]|uniref:methyltransferase family protein n=1 Tax=Rhizobium/Agrobacterium group TaxID=227290 RepID=UPI001605D968|nr:MULTISPECIES: isoprenylcysteine carboxylmethyltransferase family protein [Rhizobium/Agrobacterium group]MBB4400896.1 protein-S-isoprenylcysteine O-methyltransferase Ste14 [Agrobacterium radiobacter]MBB5587051.1 protein-S-isoprenylcysteine O-methyltransferase Ste14 [Agrobacterium radiobacter]
MTHDVDPKPMSRAAAILYAIISPLSLLALIFLPAGRIDWCPGWVFLAVVVAAFGLSALVLARVNPAIFRARSRFQPGTKTWDLFLVTGILLAFAAEIPVAALDAGRMGWSTVPLWAILLGYILLVGGIAVTAWAQAVNPFFEPGVRIQSERGQRVITSGPYAIVRHPGYTAAIAMFTGIPPALGSWVALLPATLAIALLILRTGWEDRLLQAELPGYADYARERRYRLFPGIW